ncbi:MAG TPA: helix-turn-helix domain-containing protein [Clostridia bacterium]|nr:helix-turn-helix domain-containing protein [Clostridia bacterium]
MKKATNGNQKHLTMSDRIYIEQALAEHKNFRNIAAYLS